MSCVSADSGQLIDTCQGEAPPSERVCPDNPACRHQVPQSRSHVEHLSEAEAVDVEGDRRQRWRTGEWSTVRERDHRLGLVHVRLFVAVLLQCSATCGGGVKRRRVACGDETGSSAGNASGSSLSACDWERRPPEHISCNTEPCPRWNFGRWGEVRLTHTGKTLASRPS